MAKARGKDEIEANLINVIARKEQEKDIDKRTSKKRQIKIHSSQNSSPESGLVSIATNTKSGKKGRAPKSVVVNNYNPNQDKTEEVQKPELLSVNARKQKKFEAFVKTNKYGTKDFGIWMLTGVVVALMVFFLGIFVERRFFAMIPVGPLGAFLTWFIKNITEKFEKNDPLS